MAIEIEVTYRVVTPMFCGGSDPERGAELRLASFKGVLRFWWRALAWSRCAGDLRKIREQEDKLFGNASEGQSRVLMRLARTYQELKDCEPGSVLKVSRGNQQTVGAGARYLGYGVMEAFGSQKRNTEAGQLTRGCLRAPFEFTVQLRCRDLSEMDLALLREALVALGTLGGMGAKSRKGYGSLVLKSLIASNDACWSVPKSMDGLKAAIRHLRCDRKTEGSPGYTAFSSGTRHILLSGGDKNPLPLQLLDRVGREMVRYRSWGRNGKLLGEIKAERRFKEDHNLMKGGRPTKHPCRIAFGLPHNSREVKVGPFASGIDRRASPLFIHIHECGGMPIAVVSFLPSQFLPQEKSAISVGGAKVQLAREEELYRPVNAFLDRLLDKNRNHDKDRRKEPFGDVMEVVL